MGTEAGDQFQKTILEAIEQNKLAVEKVVALQEVLLELIEIVDKLDTEKL